MDAGGSLEEPEQSLTLSQPAGRRGLTSWSSVYATKSDGTFYRAILPDLVGPDWYTPKGAWLPPVPGGGLSPSRRETVVFVCVLTLAHAFVELDLRETLGRLRRCSYAAWFKHGDGIGINHMSAPHRGHSQEQQPGKA
ncbi:hypothetical protein HaLaN_02478, partial [Haematococcus lacustris]